MPGWSAERARVVAAVLIISSMCSHSNMWRAYLSASFRTATLSISGSPSGGEGMELMARATFLVLSKLASR